MREADVWIGSELTGLKIGSRDVALQTNMRHTAFRNRRKNYAVMRIAYLLHRFPVNTDTFIKREIRSLQKAGTDVQIISVWKPRGTDTARELLEEWSDNVSFLLPQPALSILRALFVVALLSPRR